MPGPRPTRMSLGQVEDDLLRQLLSNARVLLHDHFKEDVSDDTSLEDVLKKAAKSHFRNVYGYEYHEFDPNSITPPESLGRNQPAHNLCSIRPPLGSQIAEYLRRGVFDALTLPPWMSEVAISDLTNIAHSFIEEDTQKQWRVRGYTRTYDAQIEDMDSYKCDSVMVYCNGSLLEDGTVANICVIYFVGVYYNVVSDIEKTRNDIERDAYSSAAYLVGASTIPMAQEILKKNLETYAQAKFDAKFGYKFTDNPPESLRALDVNVALLGRASNICYIPEFDHMDLRNYIEMQIFKGVDLQIDGIREEAIKNISRVYNSILQADRTDIWQVTDIDDIYHHGDPTLNPIRQSGIVMSWFGRKTSHQGFELSIHYIYFMTIVYEEQNEESELVREILKDLVINLHVHLKDPTAGKIFDNLTLSQYLASYARNKWRQTFGFEYNGGHTQPADSKPGKGIQSFEQLLFLKTYPTTPEAVEEWMDRELFRRTSTRFPKFVTSDLYDDIRNRLVEYANAPKASNTWYDGTYSRGFLDPTPGKRDLKHYALFVYAVGNKENGLVDDQEERVHAQFVYVYYLGVSSTFTPQK